MTFHRSTIVSISLSVISVALSTYHYFVRPDFDFRLAASVASLLAFGTALSEIKKHSSLFQVAGIFLSMLALGISLDKNLPAFPFITAAMLFSFLYYKRFFRKWFSETDALWLDMVAVIASFGIYAWGNISYQYGWKGWAFPVIPLAVNAYFCFSDFIFSTMQLKFIKGKKQNIEVGKPAPNFSLPDKNGQKVALSDYKDKQHVLLIFVRNDWCPSCRFKLRTYEQHRNKFNEKNIQILTISPGGNVDKYMTTNLGIHFNILYDETQQVCKSYGVQLPVDVVGEKYSPGIPLPASFLIDKKGIVRYTSRPDRLGEFLDPATIFPVLEKLN